MRRHATKEMNDAACSTCDMRRHATKEMIDAACSACMSSLWLWMDVPNVQHEEQEQQQEQQQEQEGESMLADAQYTAHGHSPPYAAFNSPRPAFETSTPCAGRRGAQL